MDNFQKRKEQICEAYSKEYWEEWPDVLDDLIAKFNDRSHIVSKEKVNGIFRAILVFDHIIEHFPRGASIIDMGCGIGYNSCFLSKKGYKLRGVDGSDMGINRAKELARQNGLDPEMFIHCDHTYLVSVPDESIDVAIAMGFLYYLDKEARDYCYRQIARILKKGGKFILTCTNQLFDAFALNDTSLRFWAEMIDDFSPVSKLLDSNSTYDALNEKVSVPSRKIEKKSISARFKIHQDNPLIYHEVVEPYGFEIEDILYPDCHVLPPALESEVDIDSLLKIKAETCVQRARDWRGIFMDYEFLAFLRKMKSRKK